MIFRVLGAAALFLGALFGVITLLVLLPFFSNFSTSLLILAAVFGVFAYVFLAIGWQLFHPPAARRGIVEETADEKRWASVSARADGQIVGAPSDGDPVSGEGTPVVDQQAPVADQQAPVVETARVSEDVVEEPVSGSAGVLAADSEPIVDTPSSTFSGFAPVPQGGEPRMGEVEEPGSGHDARTGNGNSSERAQFKKPGPPVPERSESRR
jgi:hypothetical protein